MEQISYFISGSSGFIGGSLCTLLEEKGHKCFKVARENIRAQDVTKLLQVHSEGNKKVFIHLAARVHNTKCHDYKLHYRDNVELGKQALQLVNSLGCTQFVFMSTIKVFGEVQSAPYTVHTQTLPQTAYGKSKPLAEQELISLNKSFGMQLDVVRIPLVIDMNAKGNIKSLVNIVKKGVPLPFGMLKAPRAYVLRKELRNELYRISLRNSEKPDDYLHLVCRKEGISTSRLVHWIGENLNRSLSLIPMPLSLLKILAFTGDFCEKYLKRKLPFNSDILEKIALPMEMVPGTVKLEVNNLESQKI